MNGFTPEGFKRNSAPLSSESPTEAIEIRRTPEQEADLRAAVAQVRRRALEERGDQVLIDTSAEQEPVVVGKPFQIAYQPPVRRESEPMPDPSESLAALEEAVAALQKLKPKEDQGPE